MLQIFQKIVEKGCREVIFADWTEDEGVFLLVYRDQEGRKCVLSFRREEGHGC